MNLQHPNVIHQCENDNDNLTGGPAGVQPPSLFLMVQIGRVVVSLPGCKSVGFL